MSESLTPRFSLAERIWRTGALQAWATDLGCVVGLALVGAGVYQFSRAATLIYAGVLIVAVSVLLAIDRRGAAAKKVE